MSSASLAAAYLRQRELLARFLRRRTGCEQASQDLLNDIWLRIVRSPPTDAPENPEAFLQRVASNLAGDWLRRRRFRATVVGEASDVADLPEPAPRAEDRLHYREALEFLMEVVEELPPKRKEVFLLYRGEGLSVKEVAQRLGIAEKTVEHQVAKALLHCRERLSKEGLWP